MKSVLKRMMPKPIRQLLRRGMHTALARTLKLQAMALKGTLTQLDGNEVLPVFNASGINLSRVSDYYSPLPVVSTLRDQRPRWARPSEMPGIQYDLEAMKQLLRDLSTSYTDEFFRLPSYEEAAKIGYGPGFTSLDAMILFFMLRKIRPNQYIEIGSGLSTWYSYMAAELNAREGKPLGIKCIDPFPSQKIRSTQGIDVITKEVQDVDVALFSALQAGDVLFIDSTHVVRIDGDVPYLYLEVIPRLKKGVFIHVHDIHFPFNTPFPPECYIFGGWKWPMFWTEAMLLQAFLCNNTAFKILLSAPLLRFYSEELLAASIPGYKSAHPKDMDTHFGSIWMERVGD